jgi:hypothetical protein
VGLEREAQRGRGPPGLPGPATGRLDRIERGPRVAQQHLAGRGERDLTGGAFEQPHAELALQVMAEMAAAKNAGLDNAVPRTPENTTPTTFRQWCEEVLEPAVQGR